MPLFMADSNIRPDFYGSLSSLDPHLPIGEVICLLQSPVHQITHWHVEKTKVENHLHPLGYMASCMQQ